MREYIFSAFLLMAAWQDGRSRQISVRLLGLFWFVGVMLCVKKCGEIWQQGELSVWILMPILAAALPGLILLFLSQITGGEVGEGDGVFFLGAAFFLDWEECMLLFAGGLLCGSAMGIGLILWGKIKRKNVRRMRLPFLLCLLPAWVFLLAGGSG